MIVKHSHSTVYVLDQDRAKAFYTEKLGFEVRDDAKMGDFCWLTVAPKTQPDACIILMAVKPGPRMDQEDVQERYAYSRCMTCGCCLAACPQYEGDNYIGPQAIAQVRLFNMHPSGKMTRDERIEGIMGEDGITNCGNAQNCVKACPMGIPLTRAIYEENRETVIHGLFGWLKD